MRSWKKSSMEMLWIAQIYFLIPQHASCLKQAWVESVYVFAKKQLNGNNIIVILLDVVGEMQLCRSSWSPKLPLKQLPVHATPSNYIFFIPMEKCVLNVLRSFIRFATWRSLSVRDATDALMDI